ncbi:MAG TPA: aminoglycoside phosphotransferase family protein [Ilumatobacteraceae bacterium]|nr:aminoglycoside phosphotransferase family protein [Ilumatobacteraceae bacterium]
MMAARAYVDRPVTDLVAATHAATTAARSWTLDSPELLRAGMNAIYVAGPAILRVSTPNAPAEVSLELARFWHDRGVPVPRPVRDDVVHVDDLSVTAWERIDGAPTPIDWRRVGELVRRVHETDPSSLPRSVPLPSPTTFPWWDFDALLVRAEPALDEAARRGIRAAIDRHRRWREFDEVVVCHGDVHPGNVLMGTDGPVLLDWDLLCLAPPGWDHGPMMTWAERWGGDPGDYEAFAHGYGRTLRDDPASMAIAELRLVAATLMRVAASIDNPDARAESERRLRFWRGDPDAPPWTVV